MDGSELREVVIGELLVQRESGIDGLLGDVLVAQ